MDQIGSDWIRLDQIGSICDPNWIRLYQIGSDDLGWLRNITVKSRYFTSLLAIKRVREVLEKIPKVSYFWGYIVFFHIFMGKTKEIYIVVSVNCNSKFWNWNVIRTSSHSNISMLCFSSSSPLSKCVAAVFCCIGLINPSWANTSPHTGNKRAILPTKWDKRLWNMKDMKIYKRSYSHELIKKTKKYKFYGSKKLIQVGHRGFLEHWNSQKSVCNIWQCFSCLLDEEIPKMWKKLNSHGGFLRAEQGRAKMCCQMGWIGCAILQVTQKAMVKIQYLSYFWNPFIT